jgi:hypothetical protein
MERPAWTTTTSSSRILGCPSRGSRSSRRSSVSPATTPQPRSSSRKANRTPATGLSSSSATGYSLMHRQTTRLHRVLPSTAVVVSLRHRAAAVGLGTPPRAGAAGHERAVRVARAGGVRAVLPRGRGGGHQHELGTRLRLRRLARHVLRRHRRLREHQVVPAAHAHAARQPGAVRVLPRALVRARACLAPPRRWRWRRSLLSMGEPSFSPLPLSLAMLTTMLCSAAVDCARVPHHVLQRLDHMHRPRPVLPRTSRLSRCPSIDRRRH